MVIIIGSRQDLEHQLVQRYVEGWSIRALTRHFRLGRNTVRRIVRRHKARREQGHDAVSSLPRIVRASKLDPFEEQLKALIKEHRNITGQRAFEELQAKGYEGGISILREKLNTLRPRPKRTPVVRFETEPGRQAQMDWSPYRIAFRRLGTKEALCFSYVLSHSRRQYIDFTWNRNLHTLIRRHKDAFEYFGGVPATCLYDGEKTVILRWEAGRPVFNPAFSAFITHYQCRPIGVRKAQTKGKVERPFLYVEKNLLNARRFDDLEDLRAMSRWWLRERSDQHVHDTTGRTPLELFLEAEKEALQPLPSRPYDCAEVALRVCSIDGFLEFETNRYSVPYAYVADILTLKADEEHLSIYGPDLQPVAQHERRPAGAGATMESPEHRLDKKVRYGLEPVRQMFVLLGEAAEPFCQGLQKRHPRSCGFHARAILRLKERYHAEDIHKALVHALRYDACDARAIERILKARATERTLESIRKETAREELRKSLPPITQRSLHEYAELLSPQEEKDEQS